MGEGALVRFQADLDARQAGGHQLLVAGFLIGVGRVVAVEPRDGLADGRRRVVEVLRGRHQPFGQLFTAAGLKTGKHRLSENFLVAQGDLRGPGVFTGQVFTRVTGQPERPSQVRRLVLRSGGVMKTFRGLARLDPVAAAAHARQVGDGLGRPVLVGRHLGVAWNGVGLSLVLVAIDPSRLLQLVRNEHGRKWRLLLQLLGPNVVAAKFLERDFGVGGDVVAVVDHVVHVAAANLKMENVCS